MMLLKGDEAPQDVIRLAYGLEEGLRKFYSTSAELASDSEIAGILNKLADIETRHKQKLFEFYLTLDADALDLQTFETGIYSELMEGGFNPAKLLEQNRGAFKRVTEVINLAMMFEAQAMDLYIRYAEKSEAQASKEIFLKIADEEKSHLKSLGHIMEQQHEWQ